jgi:ATP-binding cassette subfamily B protein
VTWLKPHGASLKSVFDYPAYREGFSQFGRPFAQVVISAIILQILGLAFPFFAARIIDNAVGASNAGLLVAFVSALIVATIAQVSVSAVRDLLLVRLKLLWEERFFGLLFRHMVRFPLSALDRYSREDLVSRFQANGTIRQVFSAGFVQSVLDVVLVGGYLAVIFLYSVPAGFVCVLVSASLMGSARFFASAIRSGADQSYHANVRTSGSVLETVMSAETVKLLGLENARTQHWSERFRHALRVDGLNEARGVKFRTTFGAVTSLGQAAMYAVAGAQALSGQLSLGGFAAITAIYVMAINRVQTLSTLWIDASNVVVALQKINDLFDETQENVPAEPGSPVPLREGTIAAATLPSPSRIKEGVRLTGTLRIESVSFTYRGSRGVRAVSDVNLTVTPGQRVSIVGRNGSGKSTLLKLIALLYPHYEGNICWDDREARSLPLTEARKRIGCIPQTVHIFEGTLEHNLLLARPEARPSQLRDALALSGLLDDFESVGRALSLPLLPGGSNLSGGQRLKIGFARLFLTEPDVVILDEASSALDAAAEKTIMNNVWEMFAGRTVLAAAHRLSTVIDADVIAVMSQGRLVEQGTHATLKLRSGVYSELLRAYLGG